MCNTFYGQLAYYFGGGGIAACVLFHMLNPICMCSLSAECPHCFPTSLPSLITRGDLLPVSDYLALARKISQWSPTDKKSQQKIVEAVQKIPSEFENTCFVFYFPLLVGAVCDPDGFNFHERTQNSNGKLILEYLIKASLGKCKPINRVYQDIIVCREEQYSFRIHHTTHSKRQLQSDPTKYYFTGDVVAMSFRTSDQDCAIQWMRADSPRTPKCIIADAEKSSSIAVDQKVVKMKSVLAAYSVHREVLGLVLGGNLVLRAIRWKEGDIEEYDPLNDLDLSEVVDLSRTLRELNSYLHSTCLPMTEELRLDFPVVRSRSASVSSSDLASTQSTHSRYNLRPR